MDETKTMGTPRTKIPMVLPSNLPAEIVEDILTRLPVKSLVRFRCVSKLCCTLLTTDPIFITKHLNLTTQHEENHGLILQTKTENLYEYYYIPNGMFEKAIKLDAPSIKLDNPSIKEASVQIVGSSNGLICLEYSHKPHCYGILLWNPATRQYNKLPPSHIQPPYFHAFSLGFGFDPVNNDYKVARLVLFTNHIEVEVYSLKTNSWRSLGTFPYRPSGKLLAVSTNGHAHWVMKKGDTPSGNRSLIVYFDMVNDVFRNLSVPDNVDEESVLYTALLMFKGCLYMFVMHMPATLDVWVLKRDGVDKSWAKVFNIEGLMSMPIPVELLKNDEVFVITQSNALAHSYNLESKEFQQLQIQGVLDAVPYVESLVSLVACNEIEGYVNG